MPKMINILLRTPFFGRALLGVLRARTALGYFRKPFSNLVKWLFSSREHANFTYNLEEDNIRYLASLIAHVVNIKYETVIGYIREIEQDTELQRHIAEAIEKSDFSFLADKKARFGRRVGWYAIARALKPKTIIETGVDKGLGACVLTAALMKNKEEGYEGHYYGTDINPKAGYLLSDKYAHYGTILYGDSIGSLKAFDGIVDLFINDSDHSATYEEEEYKIIEGKLSQRAIVLGDNSHATNKLLEFSLRTKRHFVFFQERPSEHWYPGAGIGISFPS